MKLACDNSISGAAIRALRRAGHETVVWAQDEPDEWWFAAGVAKGAECFVSPDWDIVLMADERGIMRVQMPNGVKGVAQATVILRMIEREAKHVSA